MDMDELVGNRNCSFGCSIGKTRGLVLCHGRHHADLPSGMLKLADTWTYLDPSPGAGADIRLPFNDPASQMLLVSLGPFDVVATKGCPMFGDMNPVTYMRNARELLRPGGIFAMDVGPSRAIREYATRTGRWTENAALETAYAAKQPEVADLVTGELKSWAVDSGYSPHFDIQGDGLRALVLFYRK